jgi:tetratricopeptide (TPR) repeat protein
MDLGVKFARVAAITIVLLTFHVPPTVTAQTKATTSLFEGQSPEQLEQTAATYEKFLHEPPAGTSKASVAEIRARLGTIYFLLHRYQDSLQVFEGISPEVACSLKSARRTPSANAWLSVPAQVWLVGGMDDLGLNRIPEATACLRRAVQLQPKNATARLALGDALARSNRMEDALKEYEQQTRQTPQLTEAWYKLGLAHSFIAAQPASATPARNQGVVLRQMEAEQSINQGRYLDGAHALSRLVRDAPNQPGIHAALGHALLEIGYPESAESQLRKELVVDPANPRAHLDLAQTAALRGNWEEVRKQLTAVSAAQPLALTRLLQMVPSGMVQQAWDQKKMHIPDEFAETSIGGLWRAWMEQSQLIQVRGSVGDAGGAKCPVGTSAAQAPGFWLPEDCYGQLIASLTQAKETSLSKRIKLAEAQFRMERYDSALQTARSILNSDREDEWGLYWFRNAHRALARQCLLKVADLDPNSARAHQMLAQDYAAWLQYPRAKKEYQAAIALAPGQSDLHLGLGTAYWRTDDLPQAEKELKLTLELAPESALARYELGDIYIQQTEWEQAFEQLRKVPPNSSVVYESTLDLAKAESELGKTSEAIDSLLAVASRDQDGQAHFLLASLYRKLGETEHAQQALETFKQLRATSVQAEKDDWGTLQEDQAAHTN